MAEPDSAPSTATPIESAVSTPAPPASEPARDEWTLPSPEPAAPATAAPADPHADLLARLGDLPDEALGQLLSHERLQKRFDEEANARASKQIDRKQKELEAERTSRQQADDAAKEARAWRETVYQARDDNPDYAEKAAALARMQQTEWAQVIRDEAANSPQVLERSSAIVVAGLMAQLFGHPEFKDVSQETKALVIQQASASPTAGAEALWQLAKARFSGYVPESEAKQREEAAAAEARDEMRKLGISPNTARSDASPAARNGTAKDVIRGMSAEEWARANQDGSIWSVGRPA